MPKVYVESLANYLVLRFGRIWKHTLSILDNLSVDANCRWRGQFLGLIFHRSILISLCDRTTRR